MSKEQAADKPLRYGYTTGSCATAATKAALLSLILQEPHRRVEIRLPIGEDASFDMSECHYDEAEAAAGTIKDGGDDPDATHGALIRSKVSWRDEPGLELDGGEGVGRVTKPGLPVDVGLAAINPVPRRMILEAAQAVLDEYGLENRGLRIEISVPGGEEIAKKTLNGRLGIIGGISILGTRGIVVPFSTSAYKASVAQAIRVAAAGGCTHIVLSTGGRSEKTGIALYPELPEEAFVEMGDFIGFALQMCRRQPEVRRVTLVGMMGKFSKLAQGVMMVHSKSAPVDFGFLASAARDAGAPAEEVEFVRTANTAAQVGDRMAELGMTSFFDILCESCCRQSLQQVKGGLEVETVLCTLKGELLGRVSIDGTTG
ncbi:cobalt-precorrin-5B (C(1))-methyltransferase [Paenibacillus sambharensis]|uniref:Cobalt-precorrin-5B C(1)-methyltransferase n=1 Tax=Paenibacillus sambharensis TaxID=1803190 RepID=A0A2W1L7H7_9BACL|nr:cobalt-precorrin-5B (C(1))-methyltransferase [Paenibacillus sambharensis]PZD96138.1 cobalt-precorrin-5B (C(1))-methyltransferase [Paenibacillus sambharensis]